MWPESAIFFYVVIDGLIICGLIYFIDRGKMIMNTKPRKLQEIFDAVIDAGLYDPFVALNSDSPALSMPYMCVALRRAVYERIITEKEETKGLKAISTYMKGCNGSLRAFLILNGIEPTPEKLLKIYRNWENRPRILNIGVVDYEEF